MTEQPQFEAFMRSYQGMVYSTAVRLLGNEAEAQDVSQEVFLKAYQRFGEIGQSPTAGGWLKTVATNLCLNHLSRYRSRWRLFTDFFSPSQDEDEPQMDFPAEDTFHDQLNESDYRQILEKALQKLPAAQRVPLVLFHFENQSYDEIASTLGVSLSKVKTDIFRGREALRRKLAAVTKDEDHWGSFKPDSAPPKPKPKEQKGNDYLSGAKSLLSPGPA